MTPVAVYTFTIGAGLSYRLPCIGSSFKILGATGLVGVKGDWGTIDQCTVGQGINQTSFQYLVFTNLTGQPNTLRVIVGDAGFIDNITGTVSITANKAPTTGAYTPSNTNVTVAAVQLLAANANRGGLLIQNKDSSQGIYVGFSAGMTAALGVYIAPGGYWEPAVVLQSAIWAMSPGGANANVLVLEG